MTARLRCAARANGTPLVGWLGSILRTHSGIGAPKVAEAANRQCFAYLTASGSPTAVSQHAHALQSSPCDGISWVLPWKDLEPAQGSYVWTKLDFALA